MYFIYNEIINDWMELSKAQEEQDPLHVALQGLKDSYSALNKKYLSELEAIKKKDHDIASLNEQLSSLTERNKDLDHLN